MQENFAEHCKEWGSIIMQGEEVTDRRQQAGLLKFSFVPCDSESDVDKCHEQLSKVGKARLLFERHRGGRAVSGLHISVN